MNEHQAFETLNINSNASFDDVKYAYRKLALELHPDKNSDEKDGEKFKDATAAYHILKNNHKKINFNGANSTFLEIYGSKAIDGTLKDLHVKRNDKKLMGYYDLCKT